MDKIYLIGLPGSGKTTLGKLLAKQLDWKFFDMDEAIVYLTDKSIPDIFSTEGEDAFRAYEKKVLEATFTLTDYVISTGGGAACFFDNIERMNENGSTVFLDVSPEEITTRIYGNSLQERPLLNGKKGSELTEELTIKREQRLHFYNQAKLVITKDKLHILDLVNMLKYSNMI